MLQISLLYFYLSEISYMFKARIRHTDANRIVIIHAEVKQFLSIFTFKLNNTCMIYFSNVFIWNFKQLQS